MSTLRSKIECSLLLPEMCFSDQILVPESTLWLLEITKVRKKSAGGLHQGCFWLQYAETDALEVHEKGQIRGNNCHKQSWYYFEYAFP